MFIPRLKDLLGGRVARLTDALAQPGAAWTWLCVVTILLGAGLYGFTVGLWHAPLQSLYSAIKIPLLIFLTCGANAALNGMLAQVLGLPLSFGQTTRVILLSFALASLILGALAPVILFLLWNTPPFGETSPAYDVLRTAHVAVIALAGVVANVRLLRLLEALSAGARAARLVLFCWLAGNLLLGSQLTWVLRPFVGSPGMPVEFLRAQPLRGNFFETLAEAARHLFA